MPKSDPAEFEHQFRALRRRAVAELNSRVFHFGTAAFMVLLFSAWDWFIDPSGWATALGIRLVAVAVIITTGLVQRWTGTVTWAVVIAKIRFSGSVLAVAGANAVLEQGYLYGMPGLVAVFLGGPYIVLDRRDYLVTTLVPLTGVAVIMYFAQLDRFVAINAWVFLGLTIVVGLMLARVFEATNRRALALELALSREARTDALTQLANRRSVEEAATGELRRQARSGKPTALILCDIDHFKQINDQHGHDAGDRTIRSVGEALVSVIRATDTAGRWGGEEFLVLLPETGEAEAVTLAERMRTAVEAMAMPGFADARATVSLGVAAVFADRDVSEHEVFRRVLKAADGALYQAKAAGRNRVEAASRVQAATHP